MEWIAAQFARWRRERWARETHDKAERIGEELSVALRRAEEARYEVKVLTHDYEVAQNNAYVAHQRCRAP